MLGTVREADYTAATLEVLERPVSPTARATTRVALAGLAAALAWLCLGRVDIVATAEGKLAPEGSVKLVQAAAGGVVSAIHVHDGDSVRAGQPLIDLDPTVAGADLAEARKAVAAAAIEIARNRAIADALRGGTGALRLPDGTDPAVADTQRRLVAARLADAHAGAASLAAARATAEADADAARAQIAKLDGTVPILDHELDALNSLAKKGFTPKLRILELERQRQAEAGDREVARTQRARGQAEARRLGEQAVAQRQAAEHTALTDLARAQADATLRSEELVKAERRARLTALTAPVDGTVQQLSVHTLGGVVEPGRPLMVIVPATGGLTLQARLRGRDAGFVRAGQPVAVKLDAYAFTRYGTVPGRVVSVSRDSIADARLGSVYLLRVRLDRDWIGIDGARVPLGSGTQATADIRTGTRPLIDYLLSPLRAAGMQAGRER